MSRPIRSLAVLTGAAVLLGALAGPAVAHVTVNPESAPKGGFEKLTFRVPNERDDSGTVKVEVTFPTEPPIPFISVKPRAGWAYAIERTPLSSPIDVQGAPVSEVVTRVTWTGGPIKAGEFDEFEVSAGPLPEDADELVFKALQTYESGEIVRWIEEAAPGGGEPEHPAAVLKLTAAEGEGEEAAAEAAEGGGDGEGDDSDALGIAAIVVGGLALLLALAGLARGRSTPA